MSRLALIVVPLVTAVSVFAIGVALDGGDVSGEDWLSLLPLHSCRTLHGRSSFFYRKWYLRDP